MQRRGHGWWAYLAPYGAFLLPAEIGRRLPESVAPWMLPVKVAVPAALLVYFVLRGDLLELRGFRPGWRVILDVLVGVAIAVLWVGPFLLFDALPRGAEADAFVVGTELDRTVHRDGAWRRVIAAVRDRFGGHITYAANWTHYEQVPFWDAVDVIGIQGYFPLAERPGLPEPERLQAAWNERLDELAMFSRLQNRKIVLAELGYSRSAQAAVRPWDGREGGEHAEETQARCLYTDHLNILVLGEGIKHSQGVAASSYTGNKNIGEPFFLSEYLSLCFPAYD